MNLPKFLKSNLVDAGLTGSDFRILFEHALKKIKVERSDLLAENKICLAVSGGSDSMALAAMAAESFGPEKLLAFIVNHQLTHLGVTEDPLQVKESLQQIGIKSEIVSIDWSRDGVLEFPSRSKAMLQTRELRYRGLFEACARHGSNLLLTGHNLDDDIVTMFYRMSRMSGIDGIAGMKEASTFPFPHPEAENLYILRPLLTVPKSRLMATCLAKNISWTHDQSNDNLNFQRNEKYHALRALQDENSSIRTESLARLLNSFKKHRQFLHENVKSIFASSVVLNKTIGESTLVLNHEGLMQNKFLFNRVLTLLCQISTNNPYPPKTASLNRFYEEISSKAAEYNRRSKLKGYISRMPERLDIPQHTLAGAIVYALSRDDSDRRLTNYAQRSSKSIKPGPCLLVQRENPTKKKMDELSKISHDFSDEAPFLWDDRIFISLVKASSNSSSKVFEIRPLNLNVVKEFEALTRNNFSARKNLYSYLGMTPATHLHAIPILRHVESGYIAMPTLNCDSDQNLFKWKVVNSTSTVIASKFICAP